MFIIEENRSDYILLCHRSLTEHHIFTIKTKEVTKFRQILKKKATSRYYFYLNCEPVKVEYIANGPEVYLETRLKYKYVCMPFLKSFFNF